MPIGPIILEEFPYKTIIKCMADFSVNSNMLKDSLFDMNI